jgi:hypothetical protein
MWRKGGGGWRSTCEATSGGEYSLSGRARSFSLQLHNITPFPPPRAHPSPAISDARRREAKGEVEEVLFLLRGRLELALDGVLEDDVARRAGEGALARALELNLVRVREADDVLALATRHSLCRARLVDKRHRHAAER